MRQQIQITSLAQKQVNTKYGLRNQWLVNGNMSAFCDQWNTGWQVGQTIDVEVEVNGRFTNLKDPSKAPRPVAPSLPYPAITPDDFKRLEAKINKIIQLLQPESVGAPTPAAQPVVMTDNFNPNNYQEPPMPSQPF